MKKIAPLILALSVAANAAADTYLSVDFANMIPSTFTLVNGDGATWKEGIYQNLGGDDAAAWTACQLYNGYGRAAFAATRTNEDKPVERWMVLPPLKIADAEAILRWEARSLHKRIAETYAVKAREAGSEQWIDLYVCEGETHEFTMRYVELRDFVGKEIELAFVATTCQGFILAVDNVFVGVPADHAFRFDNHTLHYMGVDEANVVAGKLAYFGGESPWTEIRLAGIGDDQAIELPAMACGDTVEVAFPIDLSVGDECRYALFAVDAQGVQTLIAEDFLTCSYFPRLQLVDRCSGTWCNNCPLMELSATKLENLYKDQIFVVEAHINDKLVNLDYNSSYLSEVYAIPALIPNHRIDKIKYSELDAKDNFSASLSNETIGHISASAEYDGNGGISVKSVSRFAMKLDNSDGRYRAAYMLVGDLHDPDCGFYRQTLLAMSYRYEQFYYQCDVIKPEMMYYDNVPVDASVGYDGVPGSLPARMLQAGETCEHSLALPRPEDFEGADLRVVAMLIDTQTHEVLNAAVAEVKDQSGLNAAEIDAADAAPIYYDLSGRRLADTAKGLCVERRGAKARVVRR